MEETNHNKKWYEEIVNRKKSMAIIAYIVSMTNIKDSFNAVVAVTLIVGIYIIGQGLLDYIKGTREYSLEVMRLNSVSSVSSVVKENVSVPPSLPENRSS
jgi:hypothetical protein